VFRGQLRGWFCEIAGGQSILYQADPNYPDTGIPISDDVESKTCLNEETGQFEIKEWWEHGMEAYWNQVRKHCHDCGVPLRGNGELACAKEGTEHITETHADVYKTKDSSRKIQVVATLEELQAGALKMMTDYIGNGRKS
jgi:hypothetical protein